jgi:hypothetical protein
MEFSKPQHDEIITNQHILLDQIKKSHRIFVIRFYFLLIVTLIIYSFIIGFYFIIERESFLSMIFFQMLPLIIIIRSLILNYGFIRWSRKYLYEIELSEHKSPTLIGITNYINKLYKAAFLDTVFDQNQRHLTPEQFLKQIQFKTRLKIIITLTLLAILCLSIISYSLLSDSSSFLNTIFSSSILVTIIVLVIFMIIFQIHWTKSVLIWARGFQEIEAWGKELEQNFLRAVDSADLNSGGEFN